MHLGHDTNHDHVECEDLLDILPIETVDCEKNLVPWDFLNSQQNSFPVKGFRV